MGEFIAVLNGVQFRTRHNDYQLVQPCRDCTDYHVTNDVIHPNVPPSVLEKTTVEEQILEMREYFKAWNTQNHTLREYRPYFRPFLSYLEGAWHAAKDELEESFLSDRHFLDANSWFDLHEKVRFTTYTGAKSVLENFAFLPTSIMEIENGSIPRFAQWNYRILGHPLKDDLPLSALRLEDDLAMRIARRVSLKQHEASRTARFQVNPLDEVGLHGKYTLLDKLMTEIPGLNNYPGEFTDADTYEYEDKTVKMNKAYYNRLSRTEKNDAMGRDVRYRGFSDANLFMAMTNHSQISAIKRQGCGGDCKVEERWSYAVPLEIIYLTPLRNWNPYNLKYKGQQNSAEGKTVFADGRNGGLTADKALNGTNNKYFYQTPRSFYVDEDDFTDVADTTKDQVGVLDPEGNVRFEAASGVRVFTPDIPGVGILRQRYPIFPVYGAGSAVWKELEALTEIAMQPESNAYLRAETPLVVNATDETSDLTVGYFQIRTANYDYGNHTHYLTLTARQMLLLERGQEVSAQTESSWGHSHWMTLTYFPSDPADNPSKLGMFKYTKCDEQAVGKKCSDGHGTKLKLMLA